MKFTAVCIAAALHPAAVAAADSFPIPRIEYAPRHYACFRAPVAPIIDGELSDAAWGAAPWTEDFVDIVGDSAPKPRLRTRAKMLWDENCFYIGAELEEPQLWAEIVDRDAVIYHENDFEVFIDPNGDAHEYYELEINARNTVWDLFLTRPYRDDGCALDAWDIPGLRSAVHLRGSLNDPGDLDEGWSVEIALPWTALAECARVESPPPAGGAPWRVNFSRVQWRLRAESGRYVKRADPASGETLPEDNWVWSPQGLVAMHYPEMWGFVHFLAASAPPGPWPAADSRRFILWQIYYKQKGYHALQHRYATRLDELGEIPPRLPAEIWTELLAAGGLASSGAGFTYTLAKPAGDGAWSIDEQGRLREIDPASLAPRSQDH